jgi:hypothetical protein
VDRELFDAPLQRHRIWAKCPAVWLERYSEGQIAHIMYVGAMRDVHATMTWLYEEFLPKTNLVPCGYHHEIYLNDPNTAAPEKLRARERPAMYCATDAW